MDPLTLTNLTALMGKSFILLSVSVQTNIVPIKYRISYETPGDVWYLEKQEKIEIKWATNRTAVLVFACPGETLLTITNLVPIKEVTLYPNYLGWSDIIVTNFYGSTNLYLGK